MMLRNRYLPVRPPVQEREHEAGELIRRIRKLRWIGMDDEAEHLEMNLCRLGNGQALFAEASDTD